MMLRRHTLLVTGYYLATITLLPFLVYFVTLDRQFNSVVCTPHFSASKGGTFSIYWPGDLGGYDESRAAAHRYQEGENQPELYLQSFSERQLLRIDPLAGKGTVHLLGLTLERFGVRSHFQGEDLAQRLVKNIDARVKTTDTGIEITSTSIDPQLYFSGMAPPRPPTRQVVLFIISSLLLCGFLCLTGRYFLKTPPRQAQLHLLIAPVLLVFLSLIFTWPLAVSMTACAFFVVALQHTAAALLVSGTKIPSFRQCTTFVFILCFLGLLYYPLWTTLYPGKALRGAIQELVTNLRHPKDPLAAEDKAKQFIKGIEDNLVRHFSFRDKLINLNATIKIFGLGFSPTSKAILGQNGMFFEGYGERRVEGDITASFDNVTDYMGLIPFTNEELEAWRVCLEERYYWLKQRGIDYVFAIAPSKAIVYEENLPEQILRTKRALNKPTRFEQLSDHLKNHSILPFVDLSEPLRRAKQQAEADGTLTSTPLYYRTDFHWTYYGAFVAYQAIIEEIQKRYPDYQVSPAPVTDFTIKIRPDWVHAPFISVLGLNPVRHRNEKYLTFMPRPNTPYAAIADFGTKGIDDSSIPDHVYNNYAGHMTATRVLENPLGKIPTIFVIGDSFSEKYFGFFSGHAQKTVNFRTIYSFFIRPFEEYAPNLVIQEVLNMYLLQQPPKNPPELREARIAALNQMAETAKNGNKEKRGTGMVNQQTQP
jgi:hypothetical protein